jgi:peptidyl-prolyl cis-trans isomerase SurA
MIGKRLFRWAWLLAIVAASMRPASAQAPVPFNGIQAIVNDRVISRDEVLGAAQRELTAAARTATSEQQYLTRRAKILEDQLEQLIDRQLILDEFKEKGYSFPESYVDDQVRERIRRQFGGDRVALTKTLRAENRTFEQFKKEERDDMIVYQMSARYIRDELIISPKKIQNYYQTNQARFRIGNRVKLRMIVIDRAKHSPEDGAKLASQALAQLKGGTDFAKVATEFSDDARRYKGGDRGWTEEISLNDALRKTAFGLPVGQIRHRRGAGFALHPQGRGKAGGRRQVAVRGPAGDRDPAEGLRAPASPEAVAGQAPQEGLRPLLLNGCPLRRMPTPPHDPRHHPG